MNMNMNIVLAGEIRPSQKKYHDYPHRYTEKRIAKYICRFRIPKSYQTRAVKFNFAVLDLVWHTLVFVLGLYTEIGLNQIKP